MDLLQIEKISKRFSGLQALKDVTFRIRQGEIIGLIGPNGAGKTTLFNLITGYIRPDAGAIRFKKRDITGLKPYEICKGGISRTFQIVRPFSNLTVLENVKLGAYNQSKSRMEATEKAFAICDFIGLGQRIHQLCKFLTLQDQKKLELARALATSPELILLDEVMSGLNPSEIEEISQLIYKIRESKITVLVIEHIMRAIMNFSDYIVVISFGELIAQGEPEAVVKDQKVIEAYLGEDFAVTRCK